MATGDSRPPSSVPPAEALLDQTIDETFPASDPLQLSARSGAATPEPSRRDSAAQMPRGTPATIGNQGTIPTTRVLEESVPLADQGMVTLRFDGAFARLHVYLGEGGLSLDAGAVDRLIAALSAKRAQMSG